MLANLAAFEATDDKVGRLDGHAEHGGAEQRRNGAHENVQVLWLARKANGHDNVEL